MRWQLGRQSDNVEDRRGSGGGIALKGGGLIVLALIVYALGGDPSQILQQGLSTDAQPQAAPEEQQEEMKFVSAVLANTEDVWGELLPKPYQKPVLVVYRGATESACGMGQSAAGPFYCAIDHKLYLDLQFFADLEQTLHAPGDFARAYVIAHEVGHHVQVLLGTSQRIQQAQQRAGSQEAVNALSVKLELQADCYAGVWAHHAESDYNLLEQGDAEEALNAASQIGDDRLMKRSQGQVVPDSFTHGSAEQRYSWFKKGMDSGEISACEF